MKRLALLALAILTVGLMAGAATANAPAGTKTQAGPTARPSGKVTVRFTISRFVKRNGQLHAQGTTIGTFTPDDGSAPTTVRQPFDVVAKVTGAKLAGARAGSAQRICQVLDLQLGPIDLNLLGLLVHLDKVHLKISANSRGGLLGRLFCSLAGRSLRGLTAARVHGLTRLAHRSGLSSAGLTASRVHVVQVSAAAPPCTILDLTVGPLDLNLLGLLVHLDTVHLTIKADPAGGALGSLLCQLLGP
jgi:hypothetical protein